LRGWNALAAVTLVVLSLTTGPDALAAFDPAVATLVSQVSRDSLVVAVERMVGFGTRYSGTDSNAACALWLAGRLRSLGYRDVRLDTFAADVRRVYPAGEFALRGVDQWNVVATLPGTLYPGRQIVLGAHYDSIALDQSPGAQDSAPGADDNGSGVAALLEIARVARSVQLEATLVLALFGVEELGLVGSREYVSGARDRGDNIVLMLQLDAIGTRSSIYPDGFTVDTTGPYLQLGETMASAAADYTDVRARNGSGGGVLITPRGCGCSDHQSFLDAGYPAVGVLQYLQNSALHLNTSVDTLGVVDFGLVHGITGAVLAALLEVGGYPARTPDFDGSGQVDWPDFLAFAAAFGLVQPAPGEAQYDLDRDGRVGFPDFLLFADNYGRELN